MTTTTTTDLLPLPLPRSAQRVIARARRRLQRLEQHTLRRLARAVRRARR